MKNKTSTSKSNTTATKTPAILPLGFTPIQDACAVYRGELTLLASCVAKLDSAIAAAKAEHLPTIQMRARQTGYASNRLWTLISGNPALFEKPKTRVFSDIRVGFRKQPGKLTLDEDKTIALIQKHCPDQLDILAPSTRSISKEALEKLPAEMLKKLGVSVITLTDKIIIEEEETDVQKSVAVLLKESAPELANAA